MEQLEGYMVYWLKASHAEDKMRPYARHFEPNEMGEALRLMGELRNNGAQFVTFVSQNASLVGKQGVDAVKNGKLPNGDPYTYRKGDALSQRMKGVPPVGTDAVEVDIDEE